MNKNTLGFIKLILVSFLIFITGLYPTLFYVYVLYHVLDLAIFWHWLLFPIFFYVGFALTFYSEILVSGVIIHIFGIKYMAGRFTYSYSDKNAFKWILVCTVYTPFRKLMEIFPIGRIKNTYYRLLGMNIGENTLVGGVIKDPSMTSFGSNSTMGEYALIYAHVTNFAEGTITIQPVSIGDNCVIGAGSIIMPGVTIENNVIVAAGALVTQGQTLYSNHVYAGIPAKPLPKK